MNLSLDEAIKELEIKAEALKSGKLSIDDSLETFNEATKLYEYANQLLKDIKQKVEIYNPDKGEIVNFEQN